MSLEDMPDQDQAAIVNATIAAAHADAEPAELGDFLAYLNSQIGDEDQADGPPAPAVAGTFAMYRHGAGGLMIVMSVEEGPMTGVHRAAIPAGLIRTVLALTGQSGGVMGRMMARRNRRSVASE